MSDDGIIQFQCDWTKVDAVNQQQILPVRRWRRHLHESGWIGVDSHGVGFGNLSVRMSETSFLVTGSQTGCFSDPGPDSYSIVTGWSIAENRVACSGLVQASSESLTHAMLYEIDPEIGAVIHVHNHAAWSHLVGRIPTTEGNVDYGTPAMAWEVERLFAEAALGHIRVFAMAGHEGGLVAFGESLEEAGRLLEKWIREALAMP